MSGAVFPPWTLAWGQTMVGVMIRLLKDFWHHAAARWTVAVSAPEPTAGHCWPTPPLRLPDTHRQVWLSLLWDHCSILLGPDAHRFLLCPPRVCFLWGSQSLCQIPRLGNLLWAPELSQQCKNFFGIIVLQFVGHLLGSSMAGLMETYSKRT